VNDPSIARSVATQGFSLAAIAGIRYKHLVWSRSTGIRRQGMGFESSRQPPMINGQLYAS
jgi:hypothetical protein